MHRLILAGGGHAQLSVLKALARHPNTCDVTLVTPNTHQIYSGMLPGWIAGHYHLQDCLIDLRPLAQAAGVEIVIAQIVGVDCSQRCVKLSNGRQLPYDSLSLDVGSETNITLLEASGELLLPIKPLGEFVRRWPEVYAAAAVRDSYRLLVVGGGAAGVELAFAAQHAFAIQRCRNATVTLVASEHGILPGHGHGVKKHAKILLKQRGIALHQSQAVGTSIGVTLSSGENLRADCLIAAAGARPFAWLRDSGLELDEQGYILVDSQHRSLSHPEIFAAGDICARCDVRLARSGVHAVFAGPVLAHNLLASIEGSKLQSFKPRKRSLYLLATGPQHAIASWGRFSAQGHWIWCWKNRIDLRFIRKYKLNKDAGKE